MIVSAQNRINDVKHYLEDLQWDGIRRLDTLLSDYLGADDTPYTRAVMRKSLCAAVGRAVVGGIKYDYMPIFTGPQGTECVYKAGDPGDQAVFKQDRGHLQGGIRAQDGQVPAAVRVLRNIQ